MSCVVIEFEILSEPDLSMEDSGISGRGCLSTELVDHPDISGTDNNGSSDTLPSDKLAGSSLAGNTEG